MEINENRHFIAEMLHMQNIDFHETIKMDRNNDEDKLFKSMHCMNIAVIIV